MITQRRKCVISLNPMFTTYRQQVDQGHIIIIRDGAPRSTCEFPKSNCAQQNITLGIKISMMSFMKSSVVM
jgi:hypothetical protein